MGTHQPDEGVFRSVLAEKVLNPGPGQVQLPVDQDPALAGKARQNTPSWQFSIRPAPAVRSAADSASARGLAYWAGASFA